MRAFLEKYGEAIFVIIIAMGLISIAGPISLVTKDAIKNTTETYLEHYEESDYSKSAPGLYTDDMELVATWGTLTASEKMGGYEMDVETNYTASTHTGKYSPYTVLQNEKLQKGTVLVVDSHIETIGTYALSNCPTLKKVILPNTINTIQENTFNSSSNLEFIQIPKSVQTIKSKAFADCSKLKLVLNTGVQSVASDAFTNIETLCYRGDLDTTAWGISKMHLDEDSDGKCEICGYNENTLVVEFNYQGGKGSEVKLKDVEYNQPYGELPSGLIRDGYIFSGWSKSKTGGTLVDAETNVDTKVDHTLYAQWVESQYTITFNTNEGTGSTTPECDTVSKTITYSKKYGTLPNATRPGYTLSGWFTEPEGGSKVTSYTIVRKTINHTLYAHWAPVEYDVKFNVNKGTGESIPNCEYDSMTVRFDSLYGELPTAVRDGYRFDGWFTEPDGGEEVTRTTTVTKVETHTLYAHWVKSE